MKQLHQYLSVNMHKYLWYVRVLCDFLLYVTSQVKLN